MKNQKSFLLLGFSVIVVLGLIFGVQTINLQTSINEFPGTTTKFKTPLLENLEGQAIDQKVEVIAKYTVKPGKAHINQLEKNKNAKIKHEYDNFNLLAFSLSKEELLTLQSDPEIEYIDLDPIVEPLLDQSIEDIQVDSIRNTYGYTGAGVKVAIIDTGISHGHSALQGKVAGEIDYTGEGTEDFLGHGTHVSCIVACNDEIYEGVAPGADLYVAKVIKSNGSGSGSDLIAAIDWAINQEVDVINVSLGAFVSSCGDDALSEAANLAVDQGMVFAAAAGNYGPSYGTIISPGCAEKVITVGGSHDDTDLLFFSSRGPTYDGRIKPDVLAPGTNITSAYRNNTFRSLNGTSMATPHVAGVAALFLEANNTLTHEDIKTVLKATAKDLGFDENTQGAGLVQALTALEEVLTAKKPKYGRDFGKCISEAAKNKDFDQFRECKQIFKENKAK